MVGLRVIWYNYAVAVIISVVALLRTGIPAGSFHIPAVFLPYSAWGSDGIFTFSCLIGIVTGGVYLVTFIAVQKVIAVCGPSMATLSSKLGVIFAALAMAAIWNERLSGVRLFGILFACAGLLFFNDTGLHLRRELPWLLLLSGVQEIVKKVFSGYGSMEYQYLYYLSAFVTCLVLNTVLLFTEKEELHFQSSEMLLGGLIGAANLTSTYFVVLALSALPASTVFPVQSGGAILLTTLVGTLHYGETMSKRKLLGLLLTILSIILMNL